MLIYRSVLSGVLAATLAAGAVAQTVRIPQGAVLPVVFEQTLDLDRNREGDLFRATVQDDRELPSGTYLEGRVRRIIRDGRDRPGHMDLEFTHLRVPGADPVRITALPLKWDERNLKRDPDGRFRTKKPVRRDSYVTGGLLGGLILGALIDKPFEGAMIGSIAGIILAEADDNKKGTLVVRKGDKYAAYFERRAEFTLDYPRDREDDRYADERERDRDMERERDADRYRDEEFRTERDREIREDRETDRNGVLSVEYDGRKLDYSEKEAPRMFDGVPMVALDATAKQIGASVDRVRRDDGRDLILIETEQSIARLNLGSTTYRVNGESYEMAGNPRLVEDVVYVPLEIFQKIAGGKITSENWDRNRR